MADSERYQRRLRAHVESCPRCAGEEISVQAIAKCLAAAGGEFDSELLSRTVLRVARPELRTAAARHLRQAVARTLLLSALPLVVVLACDWFVLGALRDFLALLVPRSVATGVAFGYGAAVALLFATTYAAVPILLDRWSGAAWRMS